MFCCFIGQINKIVFTFLLYSNKNKNTFYFSEIYIQDPSNEIEVENCFKDTSSSVFGTKLSKY